MDAPARAAYVRSYATLFARFAQAQPTVRHRGRPCTSAHRLLIVLFPCMLLRRITAFKAQQRWVTTHPADAQPLGFTASPHRTTLMRRYKGLASTVAAFVAFVGDGAAPIDAACASAVLVVEGSLCKARGPVWHQRARAQGRIPEQLRTLDQEATWGKRGYHGGLWLSAARPLQAGGRSEGGAGHDREHRGAQGAGPARARVAGAEAGGGGRGPQLLQSAAHAPLG